MIGIYLQPTPASRSPEHKATSCDGKRRFRHMEGGIKAAKLLRKNAPNAGPLSVYRCEFCGGVHVGKATKTILARVRIVTP